jgi:hypothetical protein
MAKISSLVAKLQKDFPNLHFEQGEDFYWSPAHSTIHFAPIRTPEEELTLLHEVAHALLGHSHFDRDLDLIRIEREAWDHVRDTLGPRYGINASEDDIEDMLDTYREWLHARSTCPQCRLTGIQTDSAKYHCVGCGHDWRVNDARRCGLRRYAITHT